MTKIESAVRERLHLLRLKSKYAGKILYSATNKKLYLLSSSDGQKIAIRLSRRITVVTRQLKKVLNEYNSKSSTTNRMSWEDATTLSVYTHSFGTSTVPDSIKQDAVRCYHEKQRAREEVGRLQSEMKNCADHYTTQRSCLLQARKCLQDTGAQDTYTLGSICLLTQRIRLCQQQIVNFIAYANVSTP